MTQNPLSSHASDSRVVVVAMPKHAPRPRLTPPVSLLSLLLPLPPDLIHTTGSSLALVGPAGTQKTALLLQAAVRMVTVTDPDAIVLYLAAEALSSQPPHVHHMPVVGRNNAHNIHIHYFESSGQLIKYLAEYQQKNTYPRAIVIDDLHIFAQRKFIWPQEYDPQTIVCKILTLARELTDYVSEYSERQCYLLVGTQETVCIRPAPKTVSPPTGKVLLPELTESLIPVISTFVENVVRVKRHEESETTDQMNIHMDFRDYHICLYVQGKQIFVDRVEALQMLPIENEKGAATSAPSST